MTQHSIELFVDAGDDLSAEEKALIPTDKELAGFVRRTLEYIQFNKALELSIRAVSVKESQTLNREYRGKDKPTNVLSFVADTPDYIQSDYIGDLAICVSVLLEEAQAQNKTLKAHWAHLCVHGVLHLLGYDHIKESDAEEMEAIELAVLTSLGFDDPYQA